MTVKILKNTTVSNIFITDVGFVLLASSNYTIDPQNYLFWAASVDIDTEIDAGNVVVNDGINDLSATEGKALIHFPDAALGVRFSVATNGYTAKNTQAAIEESRSKSGYITYTSFTGNPKKAVVTFSPAFPNTNYSVVVTGIDRRTWSIESQTTSGFTINANANQAITSSVFWIATTNWG